MSIWDRFKKKYKDYRSLGNRSGVEGPERNADPSKFAVVDCEVSRNEKKILDIGVWRYDDALFHRSSKTAFLDFISDIDFICGHNIINHDNKYLFDDNDASRWLFVDTLYLSPLLFPERPYHHLVKDDKLLTDQINNPVNDCLKAKDLLMDEVAVWSALPEGKQEIFAALLYGQKEFIGFLRFVGTTPSSEGLADKIRDLYSGKICENSDIESFISTYPCELAYALALIDTIDYHSITPGWVLVNYPNVEYVINRLRHTRCAAGCAYCDAQLDVKRNLQTFFGYSDFRIYDGEPLQQQAVQAAVDGKSMLTIFPTGGGKSLTFQLPALMGGVAVHGLTVVISPLQSLMKDQVDNLVERGITDAVTINGLLDPITRSVYIQRVVDGEASILYISPEMLRSATIRKILLARNIVRFVIDEAHCFSAWGQDFRVDYLYIGVFIREYLEKKNRKDKIPVSCFTATAKQKVVQDICDYFKHTLGLELVLFASKATRTNLRYSVIHVESDSDKYSYLRHLISESGCPTIVYVSRTKRTVELAARLTRDGYRALPFNGKMPAEQKVVNQDAFMKGKVDIIVATSAFGMGVDKSDVGLVVHYDISDSLENYVQEAGRAGRDPNLQARCYVLYNDSDLDKHFILLNQTKISLSEIQQVWCAVKSLTKKRDRVQCSALEIARQAGWDDTVHDIETRVRTALAALEQSGYLKRGTNVPHVYATGITVKNMDEARDRITASSLFAVEEANDAIRIIKSLISQKYIKRAQNSEAESRIDYLADILGLTKKEVISAVERMRQEGILADSRDISAYLLDGDSSLKKSHAKLEYFARLEGYILRNIPDGNLIISYKNLNENAINDGVASSREKDIHTLLYFLTVKDYTHKKETGQLLEIARQADMDSTLRRYERRIQVSRLVIDWLYELAAQVAKDKSDDDTSAKGVSKPVQFSVVELLEWIKPKANFFFNNTEDLQLEDVEEALLYLSKIGALKLEGGFLVIYNALAIQRLKDTKSRYRQADYRVLDEFYKLKIQQVHIVGEYANLMVRDYNAALKFVNDYFYMDYKSFISKYFKGERLKDIQRNLTPEKYKEIFGTLSPTQREVITDKDSHCIVVAAGPGSGKTRVLVHKLASLLLLEDVKHEQLLMLTFSRSAATEFKQRLMALIGNAAHFVEIKTFHSYCFDLLGRVGNLEDAKNVVARAAEMIENDEVEPSRIGKTVLVIDEAQDIGADEYRLVKALLSKNEDMRLIAVGDDDQGIYEFRGSDSGYMYRLANEPGSRLMEMVQNFRSARHPVLFANEFVKAIFGRIKTNPIVSMQDDDGSVTLYRHKSEYLYDPLVSDICNAASSGTKCVLTQTNEEAVTVVALLKRHGIPCSLIQTMSGFRFWNLAEMRYFMKRIERGVTTPVVPDQVWDHAKKALVDKYGRSSNLKYVLRCVSLFEEINKEKYIGDFKEFVFESTVEDFSESDESKVVVSTIHKAKGREYDNVYMLVADRRNAEPDNRQMRALYVGITRAKKNLTIHTNCSYFDNKPVDRLITDDTDYGRPTEVVLQLSHKDVFLGYFKDLKRQIMSLQGGDPLYFRDNYLYDSTDMPVAKLSQKMQTEITEWYERGYAVKSASVRFIVAWKPKEAPKESPELAVLLPTILLTR